jgi:membrane-associated phospholipid phosphatase
MTAHADPAPAAAAPQLDGVGRPWWQVAPLDRRGFGLVLGAYSAMVVVFTLLGFAIVELWEPSRLGAADADVNRWFAQRRTSTWDRVADYGSMLSDTLTMVVVAALAGPVMVLAHRRWRDWTLLVSGLVLEVAIFATVATLVGRDRPPVEQLDSAPTASFPSGHVAAAVVCYAAIAVAARTSPWRWLRITTVVAAVVFPVIVAVSRIFRGMHYPTDVIGGLVLGIAVVLVVHTALAASKRRTSPAPAESARVLEAP